MDWAATEVEIEEALLPVALDMFLALQRWRQKMATMDESYRLLHIASKQATRAMKTFGALIAELPPEPGARRERRGTPPPGRA